MERLNIVKMEILPKLINRFNAILIKIPAGFFVQIHRLILKCISNTIAKTILKKKNKVRALKLSNLETHYKARIINTLKYLCKDRISGLLIFDKGAKAIQWKKDFCF